MFQHNFLSFLIWLPIIGAMVVLCTADAEDRNASAARWVALVFALLTFALSLMMLYHFDPNRGTLQFSEFHRWIPSLRIAYALGVDGIAVLFILLSCFTNVIIVLAAWRSIKTKVSQYMAIFLLATGIINGAFASLDAILFYFFWEASLIPLYLGIGIWGGKRRAYAAIKFFLFTFLGSVFMLVAFLYMGHKSGNYLIHKFWFLDLNVTEESWIFLAFFAAFAVKIPMWPVHTWLPDAHTEAPAGGSVVLAALMLKLGAFGFVRFALPIVPHISHAVEWVVIILSLVAIVYVGYATIVQKDMKRLIAYSSISHMGIVTLGIFMVFMIIGNTGSKLDAALSVQGAIFQMVAHAFSSGGLFIGIGYIYDRFGSRLISDYQGVAHRMPIFAAFFVLFSMTNVGLPGTTGFVGEFMVILSAIKAHFWIAAVAALTLILAPAYTLWMVKRVIFGEVKCDKVAQLEDISGIEILVFTLLAIPIIVFGLYPDLLLNISHATSMLFVEHVSQVVPLGDV